MNNEKLLEKVLSEMENVLKGDITAMCVVVLAQLGKLEGNLHECLEKYSNIQLDFLLEFHHQKGDNKKSKKEKINTLEQKIFDFVQNHLQELTENELKELKQFIKNPYFEATSSKVLLGFGVLFLSFVEDKKYYYIPEDILQIIKEKLTDETIDEAKKQDLKLLLYACHINYGLISKKMFGDIYSKKHPNIKNMKEILSSIEEQFSIILIDEEEYIWPNYYPLLEEAKEYIYKPINRSYNDLIQYSLYIAREFEEILDILQDGSVENQQFLIKTILMDYQKKEDIVNEIAINYSLNLKKTEKIKEKIEQLASIRYWSFGGKTYDEHKMNDFVLSKKPENASLESCLKGLKEETKNYLFEKYNVKDIKSLKKSILKSFANENFTSEEKKDILKEHNQVYKDSDLIMPYDIVHAYFFLYSAQNSQKVFIPKEIEEELKLMDSEFDEDIDYVDVYMTYNGIIEKKQLQTLLKKYHNIDYSIKELDQIILEHNFTIQGDYYSVLGEFSDFEYETIFKPKKDREYKIVTQENSFDIDVIDYVANGIKSLLEDSKKSENEKMEFIGTILMLLHMSSCKPEILKELMKENSFTITKQTFNDIMSFINENKNDFPLWAYNGFTAKEINTRSKKKKIGRNDPCPCGSGKKYKQCCGK